MTGTSRFSAFGAARVLASVVGAALLAGCSMMTGQNFTAEQLSTLVPGRTTMIETTRALNAPPSQIFPQSDGSTVAMWDFKFSLVTDAVYHRKEAILQFGADGRLIRLVDTTNIILASESRRKLLGVYVPSDSPEPGETWQPAPLQ